MNAPLIGARIERKEDYRFLTGAGQYTDDVELPRHSYAAFVRSPHAHAIIKKISSAKAKASPGVLAVFTGEDFAAAELVEVDYEVLPAVVDGAKARAKGAPQLHDIAPENTCYVWALGDKAVTDAAFAKAAHVTRLEFINNRLIPNAIEPRVANGSYSRADDSYTLYVASQNPHVERLLMTAFVMGLPEHKVRVVAGDVGGGFGSKIYLYAEDVA